MKKNGLNKLLALLLALVMVLSLAACGNKAQDNGAADKDAGAVTDTDNNTGDNGDAAAPQDRVVADGDVIGEGKTAFTVEVAQLDGTSITFTVISPDAGQACYRLRYRGGGRCAGPGEGCQRRCCAVLRFPVPHG